MTPLNQVLLALGGNATLLIVLGFLSRSLLQTWLAKDLKKFESDLQHKGSSELERLRQELKSQADVSIEQMRSRLQQVVIEHQIRFSRLHEKRAGVIEQLYRRAYNLELSATRYTSTLGRGSGEDDGQEMYRRVRTELLAFDDYRERHRIYLSDDLDATLVNFSNSVREPIVTIGVYGDFGTESQETLRRYRETILAAVQAMTQQVPLVRAKLIKAFRAILSGEAD